MCDCDKFGDGCEFCGSSCTSNVNFRGNYSSVSIINL